MRPAASVILLSLAATALSAVPTSASAETTEAVVPVAVDAHVKAAHKRTNYGRSKKLIADGRKASQTVAMLRIRVPEGAGASAYQLMLHPITSSPRGVRVFRTGKNWKERAVTWEKRPKGRRVLLGASNALHAGVTEVINLDPAQVKPGRMLSLRIRAHARTKVVFASTEGAASSRPQVKYTKTTVTAPVPIPSRTMFGACPTVGTPSSSVISKYGVGAAIRMFEPGGFNTVERPAGASMMHVSWKPPIGSAITDSQLISAFANLKDGDMVEVWHESDVKYRKGDDLAAMLAMKNAFHDRVVALRNAGRIPYVLTVNTWAGWSVDSTSNIDPSNLHARADILGLDMDGMPVSDNFYPFAERQLGAKFVEAYREGGYSGWTVPEFSLPAVTSDPTRTRRVAWIQAQAALLTKGVPSAGIPAPKMIAWFDTEGIVGEIQKLTTANEVAAWSAAVATNVAARVPSLRE